MSAIDPRVGTLVEGRYQIEEPLGAGGMGVVYRATAVAISKAVAVKFLHEAMAQHADFVKRFQREVASMSVLSHPNLVSVIDSGLVRGVPYLVMDFIRGHTLSAELQAKGAMPASRALRIARQLLSGLKHAHAAGIVHRDLKPDNVLLLDGVDEDFAMILDFGLARLVQGDEQLSSLTSAGTALGTPSFMSPEQANGRTADERSDLYSLGIMLYNMLVGRRPFIAESPIAIVRMQANVAPTPPRQARPGCVSAELERVILKALEKDPAARFQNAQAMLDALARIPEVSAIELLPIEEQAKPPSAHAPSEATKLGRTPAGARKKQGAPASGSNVTVFLVSIVIGATAFAMRGTIYERGQQLLGRVTATSGAKPEPTRLQAPTRKPAPSPSPPPTPTPAPTPTPTPAPSPDLSPPADTDEGDEDDEGEIARLAQPADAPGAKLEQQAAVAPEPQAAPSTQVAAKPKPTVDQAAKLIAAGKIDEALSVLYAVRRQAPRSPGVALFLGHAYFKKRWRSDGLREYDAAIKLQRSLRSNATLIANTIVALDDPTYRAARAVLKARIGAPARAQVTRAAKSSPNPKVKARAHRLLKELR